MAVTRQDAWTEDDDLLLAEVTLRHIREGSTQLAAFEEIGYRLNRTAAACGFRWNSLVRKQYESAIQIAKAQRAQLKSRGKSRFLTNHFLVPEAQTNIVESLRGELTNQLTNDTGSFKTTIYQESKNEAQINYDDCIRFLRQQKELMKNSRHLDKTLEEQAEEIELLRTENNKIKKELHSIQEEYQTMHEDYQALMKIMERARKLAFLAEEEAEQKVSFKMDRNGNLERVEK